MLVLAQLVCYMQRQQLWRSMHQQAQQGATML
jgi:hypothetical protein